MAQLLISWAVTQFVGDGRKVKKAWADQLAEKSGCSSPVCSRIPRTLHQCSFLGFVADGDGADSRQRTCASKVE
jgi:hypothetical protein